MNRLRKWIYEDMKPALGVTEPAAIALACAKARSLAGEPVEYLKLTVNSGIYKNAFTCGIPGTTEQGNAFAAALGCVAGKPEKELLVLEDITEADVEAAKVFLQEGRVRIDISGITSELYIRTVVKTAHHTGEAVISHSHTNFTRFVRDGQVLLDIEPGKSEEKVSEIRDMSWEEMLEYVRTAPAEELEFMEAAHNMNLELAESAFSSERCVMTAVLQKRERKDSLSLAELYSGGAAEARVLGFPKPAMSITGSGNHGIICTMPLYAFYERGEADRETLLRGTALSYLITMYMKEYSGKLSAFCGCGVAAGTGAACGLTLMRGGDNSAIERTLYNMTASLVGMICHGGNHGCVMKVLSAAQAAYTASELAMAGACIHPQHGIGGMTPEQTMRNIGRIADPGMVQTEGVILEIMREKEKNKKM